MAGGVFQRIVSDVEDFGAVPGHFHEGGDTAVVEGRYRRKVKTTGRTVDAQFAHVWQLRDGKVVRFQQYTDTKRRARAAGARQRRRLNPPLRADAMLGILSHGNKESGIEFAVEVLTLVRRCYSATRRAKGGCWYG